MATIVVHGTMTHLLGTNAQVVRWWWDSWQEGGFLHAVREGMRSISGTDDLWTVGGRPVSEIEALQQRDFVKEAFGAHQGCFTWTGGNPGFLRNAGGLWLAHYLNRVKELAPRERLAVVAHSHGCNVVKVASSLPDLAPQVHIDHAVFLGCPHFFYDGTTEGYPEAMLPYRLDPQRFGRILNLYSETDTVQFGLADALPGLKGKPKVQRVDHDAEAAQLYENWPVQTQDAGPLAHTVLHGAAVGSLVGVWPGGTASFQEVLDQGGADFLPVPAGDVGE